MIREKIEKLVLDAVKGLGVEVFEVILEHPSEPGHGDYSTNVAMVAGKESGKNPRELANEIVRYIVQNKPDEIEKVEVAGPGFINFFLSQKFFVDSVAEVVASGDNFGKNKTLAGKKVMIEYTDPNPFKEFHVGHLMSNAIGESLSRLLEYSGGDVKRVNYYGDVGLHIAMAVWAIKKSGEEPQTAKELNAAYAEGRKAYDEDEGKKKEIEEINRAIYEKSDSEVRELYEKGKELSIKQFEKMYDILGTKFDFDFPESETDELARAVVKENIGKVFEESDGAVIFRAEKYDPKLHTRVFLNSQGLPVYEAKEVALAKIKYDKFPYDVSVVVTGNDIEEYFKVLLVAMKMIYPELAEKTIHKPHGMLRLPEGKMSSRTGEVVSGEALINEVKTMILEKMADSDVLDREKVAEQVAVAALKYSILRQAVGHNIIFDFEKSLSFEGDSGPYLQYTYARAQSVLEKAKAEKIPTWKRSFQVESPGDVERMIYQFPEVVEKAREEYAPHKVVTYLTALAGAFNTYYAKQKIVDSGDESSPYRVALTEAVSTTLKNGLWLLGIKAPEKM